jgi:hypothetical protein
MALRSRLVALALALFLGTAASCSGTHRVAATLRSADEVPTSSASAIPSPSITTTPSPTTSDTPAPTPESRTWSGQFGDAELDLTISPTNASSTSEVRFSYHVKIGLGHHLSEWSLDAGDDEHLWTTPVDEPRCPLPPATPIPGYEASYSYHAQLKPGHYKPQLHYSFVTCNPDGSSTAGPDGSVEGDLDVH